MPNKALLINGIGILLQYSVLAIIYYFLFKVIKTIYLDLKMPMESTILKEKSNDIQDYQGKLVVLDKGHVPLAKTSYLIGETMTIGRNEHNEIIIDDAFVSFEHASINRDKQGYWLTDLNSTNKTYLNSQPVQDMVLLKNGDLIKIGAVTFSFEG